MKRPVGINVIVALLAALPFILIAFVAGFSWESLRWTVVLAFAPFSTIWYAWLFALWHHRNWARWLVNISTLLLTPLWLLNLGVATTAREIWTNRIYLCICLLLLLYINLPKVRRWFLQQPPQQSRLDFDKADFINE